MHNYTKRPPYRLTLDLPKLAEPDLEPSYFRSIDDTNLILNSPYYRTLGLIILSVVNALIIATLIYILFFSKNIRNAFADIFSIWFYLIYDFRASLNSWDNSYYFDKTSADFDFYMAYIESEFLFSIIATFIFLLGVYTITFPIWGWGLRARPLIFNRKVGMVFYVSATINRIYYIADWHQTVCYNTERGGGAEPMIYRGLAFKLYAPKEYKAKPLTVFLQSTFYTSINQWEYIRNFMLKGEEGLPRIYFHYVFFSNYLKDFRKVTKNYKIYNPIYGLNLLIFIVGTPLAALWYANSYITELILNLLSTKKPIPYLEDASQLETEDDLLKFYEKYGFSTHWIKVYEEPQNE